MTLMTTPLRHLAQVRVSNVDKKSVDGQRAVSLCNYTDVYYSATITRATEFMPATATAGQIRDFALRAGDTLITKDSETADDIGVAAYVVEDLPGVLCGYHLALIRPRPGTHGRYLSWAVQSDLVRGQWEVSATGVTRYGLNYGAIRGTAIPTHPLVVQRRIADFLDDQITRIDGLVAARSEMIALAHERAASLIQSLVLGRVDREVRTQPSGPVLPAPAGWATRRNKTFLKEIADLSETGTEEMLTVSHLTGVTPRSEKTVYMFEAETKEGYKRVRPGDLVVNTLWAWMGALGVTQASGIVSPAYGVYRFTDPNCVPEYFDALFRSRAYVTEMTRYSKGVWTSRLRLYPESFLSLRSPFPPREDQLNIANEVSTIKTKRDTMCGPLARSLELLKERKRSLITAAVTGEFDVSSASSRAADVVLEGVG